MEVILATVEGYDGTTVIGIFSSKEKAYDASVKYLLENSETGKLINEEELEHGWIYDITNTFHNSLVITKYTVDEKI